MKTTLFAMICLAVALAYAKADSAGLRPLTISAPHHARALEGVMVYPGLDDGTAVAFGANPVFVGAAMRKGATLADGPFPVVLLSHGLGGNIRTLSWLAAGLAERGALVAMVNHPNSTTGDFDMQAGLRHGTRAQDLSLVLDELLTDPDLAPMIDRTRIMAAGFSYGGWTALSLGGMRGNLERYRAHCKDVGQASSHCADIEAAGVSLTELSAEVWDAAYGDARITHVAAIDPGPIWGLKPANAAGLIGNVRLVSLGYAVTRLFATDIYASGLRALLPEAEVTDLAPAAHFTALPPCTDIGAAILAEEGDEPVCTDPKGTDRRAIHAQIIDVLAADLGL